jgi:hypothetical protein
MNGAVPALRPLGSERLRLPPQIRPQPTHPVRQNTAWHTEVNGDVGVRLDTATPPAAWINLTLSSVPMCFLFHIFHIGVFAGYTLVWY